MKRRNRTRKHNRPTGKIAGQDYSIARMLIHAQENPSSPLPSYWQALAAQAAEEGYLVPKGSEEAPIVTEKGEALVRVVRRRYAR